MSFYVLIATQLDILSFRDMKLETKKIKEKYLEYLDLCEMINGDRHIGVSYYSFNIYYSQIVEKFDDKIALEDVASFIETANIITNAFKTMLIPSFLVIEEKIRVRFHYFLLNIDFKIDEFLNEDKDKISKKLGEIYYKNKKYISCKSLYNASIEIYKLINGKYNLIKFDDDFESLTKEYNSVMDIRNWCMHPNSLLGPELLTYKWNLLSTTEKDFVSTIKEKINYNINSDKATINLKEDQRPWTFLDKIFNVIKQIEEKMLYVP